MSRRSMGLGVILACSLVLSLHAAPKWQLPLGVRSIEVNGYDMAYQEAGSGMPIVLVHGTLNDYRVWLEQVPLPSACGTTTRNRGTAAVTIIQSNNTSPMWRHSSKN
jgi:hypothetical protein